MPEEIKPAKQQFEEAIQSFDATMRKVKKRKDYLVERHESTTLLAFRAPEMNERQTADMFKEFFGYLKGTRLAPDNDDGITIRSRERRLSNAR